MAMTEPAQQQAVRRAYEFGRLRYALRMLWVVLPLACVGLALGSSLEALLCLTTLLLVAGGWLRWKGGRLGSAVLPGVLAGSLPLSAAPVAAGCCAMPSHAAVALALIAVIAGAALAMRARQRGRASLMVSLGAALATACLTCMSNGPWMVLGAALGLLAGSIGLLALRGEGRQ